MTANFPRTKSIFKYRKFNRFLPIKYAGSDVPWFSMKITTPPPSPSSPPFAVPFYRVRPSRLVTHRNRVRNTEIVELLFRISARVRGLPRRPGLPGPPPSPFRHRRPKKKRARAWVGGGRQFRGTAEDFDVLELSHIDPGRVCEWLDVCV